MSKKTVIAALAILMGSCELQPAIAQGVKANPESFFLTPPGFNQAIESLSPTRATFSKMTPQARGPAGFSFIWINGMPWLVRVWYPDEKVVKKMYPWYEYPTTEDEQ